MAPINNPVQPTDQRKGENEQKKVGPIVSTLVIVLVLIIAALYLFAQKINKEPIPTDATPNAAGSNPVSATGTVPVINGKSNDPASLQNDLNASTQNLDQQNF